MGKINASAFGENMLFDRVDVIDYNGIEVSFKHVLTFPEMTAFVNCVTNACFDVDTGEYMPEAKDFALRYAILKMYTNIEPPEDEDECYKFVYQHEDLLLEITSLFDTAQFGVIGEAIDKKIDNLLKTRENDINKLVSTISIITNKFANLFDGVTDDDIVNLISSLSEAGFDESKFVETYMKGKSNNK